MNQLICMVGLPYSGKTTVARSLGHPIVNPDSIRWSTYGQRYWSPGEPMVWSIAWIMCRSLFVAGHENVILDATNTKITRRNECTSQGITDMDADVIKGFGWDTVFHHITTPVETCIARANQMGDAEIIETIERMEKQFEPLQGGEQKYQTKTT